MSCYLLENVGVCVNSPRDAAKKKVRTKVTDDRLVDDVPSDELASIIAKEAMTVARKDAAEFARDMATTDALEHARQARRTAFCDVFARRFDDYFEKEKDRVFERKFAELYARARAQRDGVAEG